MGMTEQIYRGLSIPGFAEARNDIEKYVGGKKGYKKNKYKYDDRTVQLVDVYKRQSVYRKVWM